MRDALDGARTAIAAGGSPSPRLDAELLLAAALGCRREQLYTDSAVGVTGDAVRTFQAYVRRRSIDREPVAYILGRRAFRRLELHVSPAVLIPRPESELLVEVGLELAAGARVLDCATGSGAVVLALADERPDLELIGSDISEVALAVAERNGERLGFPVRWERSDLLDDVAGAFDAILSNPPYVETMVLASLEPEVSRHEPPLALDGGANGLAVIARLIAQASDRTSLLAIEHGDGQETAVAGLARASGFTAIEHRRDLSNRDRVLVARR